MPSSTGVATESIGSRASRPSSSLPRKTAVSAITELPRSGSGTSGNGGRLRKRIDDVSSSGAVAVHSRKASSRSADASTGQATMPP